MPKPMLRPSYSHAGIARRAFTLIELLVVIAIISILVALLFPVFATARESARESATSTHLHEIQNALALYKLDNKQYPPVLFAYTTCMGAPTPCVTSFPMSSAVQNPTSDLVGLYPTYVKDWHDFTCPDNLVDDPSLGASPVSVNTVGTVTAGRAGLSAQAQTFYAMDAMDVSPQLDTATSHRLVNGSYVARYQTSWESYHPLPTDVACTPVPTAPDCLTATTLPIYTRQLRWTNPPPNTYVTSLTYHVPNRNVVMVLYESGTVVTSTKIGVGAPVANYDDSVSSVAVTGAATTYPDSPAKFWQFTASQ